MILEEMNVYLDTPQRYVGNVYDRLLYADQPLGWDIIGTRETVQDATRETFYEYLDTWYRPERMVVGIGGRIGEGLTREARRAARRNRSPADRPSLPTCSYQRTRHPSSCTRRTPSRRT